MIDRLSLRFGNALTKKKKEVPLIPVMDRALVEKFGIPIAMLFTAKDSKVQIECTNGEKWSGTLVNVDEAGNVELANAEQTAAAGGSATAPRPVKSAIIRSGAILFTQLTDTEALSAQWPMLKTVTRAGAK